MAASSHTLEPRVAEWIRRHRLLPPGVRVAVAVSGGSDSVALLLLLAGWAEAWGLQVSVAHYDHGWRAESGDDAEFVAALAGGLHLPFHLGRAGARPVGNLEHGARRARYAFFQDLIASGEVDRVATGHTADDQAETVLLRLLRGAGPGGLAGILPVRDCRPHPPDPRPTLVRPLLAAHRDELQAWLRARRQGWREDVTNRDLSRRRNWLRHEILPRLGAANPGLTGRLGALADLAAAEELFWNRYLEPLRQRLWQPIPGGLRASPAALRELPLAVRRRLLRDAAWRLQPGRRQLDFAQLDRLVRLLDTEASRNRHLRLGALTARLSAHALDLVRQLGYT